MPFRRSPKPVLSDHQRTDVAGVRLAALKLLAGRDFATRELNEKLLARGFDADTVADTIAQLMQGGEHDESRYARGFVASHVRRGQGPVRIGADLRQDGVAEELIAAALAEGTDWVALARKVRQGKFGADLPTQWAEKARQARFLQYRGFSSDHIRAATGAVSELD
jgi:regulatory protein